MLVRAAGKWVFSLLCVNLAVAIVALIQIAGEQISTARELGQMLAYSLPYANVTGVLGVLLIGAIVEHPALRRLPLALLAPFGIGLSAALGCLLVQALMAVPHPSTLQQFWSEYLHTLRVAVPLAIVFGSGAFLHASLRDRAQASEAKLREKEISDERTRKLLAEARLRELESRIHPHFLFNTLNAISSLIAVDPARAEKTVDRLALLLRASLDSATEPLIPLRQELAIVESYLDVQQVRFGNKLHSTVSIPIELNEARVPTMSVQTLVENAVKHGIGPRKEGGEIRLTASADESRLQVEVCDSGPGFDLTDIRAGHGLDNLIGRLDALFGVEARLNIYRREGRCVTEIVLPLV